MNKYQAIFDEINVKLDETGKLSILAWLLRTQAPESLDKMPYRMLLYIFQTAFDLDLGYPPYCPYSFPEEKMIEALRTGKLFDIEPYKWLPEGAII